MATSTPAGTVWQMTLEYRYDAQVLLNTFHYLQVQATADYALLAAAWDTKNGAIDGFFAKLIATFSSGVTLTYASYQPIALTRLRSIDIPHTLNGDLEGTALPPNSAQTITRRGVGASRHNMGAVYLPPPPAGAAVNGSWSDAQMVLLSAFAPYLYTEVSLVTPLVDLQPVLVQRKPTIVSTPIADAFPQPTCRVQRRRTVGVGK